MIAQFSTNQIGKIGAVLSFSLPHDSIVIPVDHFGTYPKNQKSRNLLRLRDILVAGVGFEPTTFRL
jgi:hypothetical protein